MTADVFRVRVKDGSVVSGISPGDDARLNLLPKVYEVHWLSRNRPQATELEAALRFLGADTRGGDLDVFRSDYPELADINALPANSRFELI